MDKLGFAQSLAQSRSFQGIVRVMNKYCEKHGDPCKIVFSRSSGEGVEVDVGTNASASGDVAHQDFLDMLNWSDELMLLQSMIEVLRDRRADPVLIGSLVDEAKVLVERLYPGVVPKGLE